MTVTTSPTIGPAAYKSNSDYIFEKWFRYVLRGITGKSLADITRTEGNVDVATYSPERLAAWQHCVRENGYTGSLEDHKDHLHCEGL